MRGTALIYLRVSTGAQAAKELPLDTQREACLRLGELQGFQTDPVADMYVDSVSGRKIEGRNALQLMMERCKIDKEVKAIIIYDISRLSRNAMEYYAIKTVFQKKGIGLFSVNEQLAVDENPAGWLMEYILSGFAEFRSRQDGEKIKNSMRNKVQSGGWCGYAHYGYKNVQELTSSNKSKRWIEPNPQEAPWVQKIHDLYAIGEVTFSNIAEMMQEQGMPTRNGGKVHPSLIEQILKDEVYIGVVAWGGTRSENGIHKPLVDKETFYRNQDIIASRNHGASRKRKHYFIVRSLGPVCGECGSKWTAGYSRGRSGAHYGLYHCKKNQKGKRVECSQSSIPVDELENKFEDLFKKVQLPQATAERLRERIKGILAKDELVNEKVYQSLRTKLENVRLSQRRLVEKYAEGKIPDEVYEDTQKKFEVEEQTLRRDVDRADAAVKDTRRIVEVALALASNCHRAYQKAPTDELRGLLAKAFFKRIVLRSGGIYHAELNQPFQFLVEKRVRGEFVFNSLQGGGSGRNRTAVQKGCCCEST